MSEGSVQRRSKPSRFAPERSRRASAQALSVGEARSALAARLRERLPELQGAVAARVYAISDPREVADPGYLQGLNDAMAAAIEYRLEVLEGGERQAPDVPAVLLAQARATVTRIHKGRFGLRLKAHIPKVAGGAGSATKFDIRIGRRYTYKGRKKSFLTASCPTGSWATKGNLLFSDQTRLGFTHVFSCMPTG